MRRLAIASIGFSAGVFLAQYVLPLRLLPVFAGVFAALGLGCLLVKGKLRLHAMLLLLPAAIGLVWSLAYNKINLAPAEKLAGTRSTVTAVVVDYPAALDGYSRVYVRVLDDGMPHVKAAVYDYNASLPEVAPGDIVSMPLKFRSAAVSMGQYTDTYTSRGIFLAAYLTGTPRITGRAANSWIFTPQRISHALQESVSACFPEDTAPFMKALLTGDRTDFFRQRSLYDAFGKAGFMHVVAISGLHLVLLVSFLCAVFGKGRLNLIVCFAAMALFIPMTGGGAPVIRAAFMQCCVLAAPLLRRENDGVTTLSASLALLLLINPMSARAISLQLSFTSILGITCLQPRIYGPFERFAEKRELDRRPLIYKTARFIASSLSVSLGALVFSFPILALRFGYVTLYAWLTNLFCLWLIEAVFIAGMMLAVLGLLLPGIASVGALVLSWPVRFIFAVSTLVAGLPMAAVFTCNRLYAVWLAASYLAFLASIIFRPKGAAFRPVIPLCLTLIFLCTAYLATTAMNRCVHGRVTVLDVGQGQCVGIFSGGSTVMVDCGSSNTDACEAALQFLRSQARPRVDALILTHLHRDHCGGAAQLMRSMDVARVILPADADDEDDMLDGILSAANDTGAEVLYVDYRSSAVSGDLSLSFYAMHGGSDANERGLFITASIGDFDMLITGDAGEDMERQFLAEASADHVELYIVGHHGSKYSTSQELLSAVTPEQAVISVGYNSYGHPTGEALARLEQSGAAISRTDEDGNITIWIK